MSRGRITKLEPPKEASRRVVARGIGSGPPCPEGHGHMYDWGSKWFCAHSAHGGNGRFYKESEVS